MKNPSKKYWEDRAAGRMVSYTAKAESTADTLGKAYYATARYLQGKANDVFNAFTDKFELSIAEAETMLKNAPNKSMFEQMKTALATCADEQKKQKLETLLSSPAYAHRIWRLNDLDSKISDMCSRLANTEIGVDTAHLGDIIQSAYMQTVFDVTKGADYRAAFDLIPESRVKAILSTNWSGQMFSQRVWDNTNALADGLKHDMLVGIMAGKSEQHMADDIMSRCGVGAFEARRLVRTETTCVANMAELYGYKELDIDEYEFSACLDSRTSDLCRELDGKVFKRNSAQAGVNLPPMHPFCRSTTLPVLPSEEDLDKELAKPGDEIGADVDFDEWERNLQQGEDGKWRYVAGSAGKVKADKPMRFAGDGVDKSGESVILKLNSKFVNPNDNLYEYADLVKPIDGYCDIVCHGSPTELIINGLNNEEWTYTAKEAAEMIRNSAEFNGQNVRLISCQTGAGDNCIAQQIANELGVEVMAPSEIVNINSDGEMFLSNNGFIAEMWDNGEDVVETGKWIVFKPRGGN